MANSSKPSVIQGFLERARIPCPWGPQHGMSGLPHAGIARTKTNTAGSWRALKCAGTGRTGTPEAPRRQVGQGLSGQVRRTGPRKTAGCQPLPGRVSVHPATYRRGRAREQPPRPNTQRRIIPAADKGYRTAAPQLFVSRTRLIRQITTPLTLICAPSGFGKSTLLNDWKRACGFPVAWLTLDERDNNPVRFWYSVVTTLPVCLCAVWRRSVDLCQVRLVHQPCGGRSAPDERHSGSESVSEGRDHPRRFSLHQPFAEIFDAIQIWLKHFPANLQLVISGHSRPPLALGQSAQ